MNNDIISKRMSYWQVFRLIFVVFLLYLMGDAFYRWDGFKYYASFSEFLPSVALITILWSIIAVLTSLIILLSLRAFEWFCLRTGLKLKVEHLLILLSILVLLGGSLWAGKRLMLPYTQVTVQFKFIVLLCVVFISILFTWFFRKRSERWIDVIQERITPLVWLFGIWFVVSVPLVAYHTWVKQIDYAASQKMPVYTDTKGSRPNIILITFDALTARDMSVYGYHRPTTPFIKKWAEQASLFTRVQAESNITTPTTTSLMTGKRLWTHQTYHIGGAYTAVRNDMENLASELKNNGYYNMAFIVNHLASVETLNISRSFDIAPLPSELSAPVSLLGIIDNSLLRLFGNKIRLHDWLIKEDFILDRLTRGISGDTLKTTYPPEKAFNRFLSVIDSNPHEPYFAWIHLYPPHSPYLPSEPYMGIFDSSAKLRTFKTQKNGWDSTLKYQSVYQHFSPDIHLTVDILRARYDEFIKYCDKQFEDFLTQLMIGNKLKNTVIILSSDHGEGFEHDFMGHAGPHLYEQMTHIPLIIKEPDQTDGRIINDLVEQIDITATIIELANISIPPWMEGRSLVPLIRGKWLLPKPAISMSLEGQATRGHKITKGTIALWEGDYKLIHYLEENKSLLFNLREDPDELNNLFEKEQEKGQILLGLLQKNLKDANDKITKEE